MVVDLPAPFGPRKPNVSRVETSKSTPSTAWTSPYALRSPRTSIAATGSTLRRTGRHPPDDRRSESVRRPLRGEQEQERLGQLQLEQQRSVRAAQQVDPRVEQRLRDLRQHLVGQVALGGGRLARADVPITG